MHLTVKRILMDVDGTMTDTPAGSSMAKSPLRHLTELVMQRHGVGESGAERMIRGCGDMDTRCLSEFLPALDIDPVRYFEVIKADLSDHIVIPEDTVNFLKKMKERGIPVCAATANSRFMTLAKLAAGGLAGIGGSPYIAAYHSGCEFCDPKGKFSDNFFPNILKHHGYDPATLMMIGDEPEHDLYPALKAGIRYGVIIDRGQKAEMIERDGGIFVKNLETVSALISA